MLRPPDVLIAGAGPAGAATAIRLARAGLEVVVVDRAVFPRDKICSEYNSPEGVRHLAQLGVLESIERQGGHRIRGTSVDAPGGARLTGLFARAGHAPFRDTGLSIPRTILDAALVDGARRAGAVVLERTTVRSVIEEQDAVRGLVVGDERGTDREIRARLTIGADGLHSLVANRIGARTTGSPRRFGFVAHVTDVAGLGDTAEMHVGSEGYVGLNPLGGGLANVALVVPARRAAAARGGVEEFFFSELARYPRVAGRVPRSAMVRPVLTTGPFSAWSRRVIAPGALLVGDAADFFDPFTGEGICAALRGAELAESTILAALARPGPVSREALRPYARARWRTFHGKWLVERAIGYAMLAPALFDRAVERLERRGLAHTLIGVTGDFVPPRAVLNPVFLPGRVLMPLRDVDAAEFRQLCGHFATGVVVLTAPDAEGRPAGMTANSFASVSLSPPLMSVNVDHSADMHAVMKSASRFVINILRSDQEAISRRFAGNLCGRFDGIGYRVDENEFILLDGVLATITCESHSSVESGDHTIFIGRIKGGAVAPGRPLLYYRGGYVTAGHP